ncbi:RNA-binding protein cabeza isoform X2 [Brassica napus]|uniref:RNA-binding protein cabeza isoform X2 n=1 Tax=Brassica napus TaxID=3708 RepID=UPI002078EDCD|nr:RNA-binding protein cabeza isoform X2 [Brassica napus]
MERYSRVEKPKLGSPINENEIRITSVGLIRNYISYAITLLHEKGAKEIVLKAMGQAISKTVTISEILKSKVPGLHQDVNISSMSITDVFEPIEEGLLPVEVIRHVSMISITLSLSELNQDSPGYQAPAQIDQSKPLYQPNQARLPYNAYREGDVAGEEVDMETTKGVIKGSTTKGTIKKIIKKMMAGIQTGAGVVVLDGAMAIVVSAGYGGGRDSGYGGGRDSGYGGGRDGGYGGGRAGYGGRRYGGYGGGRDHAYGGGRDHAYGGGKNQGYGGGRDQGYGGGRDQSYGGGKEQGYGGGREEGFRGRRGGFRGGRGDRFVGGRDDGYGGGRGGYGRYEDQGDGYGGGGQGDMYKGGRGGYGGGRGYGRGRGRMGNDGRSRGGASNQKQA